MTHGNHGRLGQPVARWRRAVAEAEGLTFAAQLDRGEVQEVLAAHDVHWREAVFTPLRSSTEPIRHRCRAGYIGKWGIHLTGVALVRISPRAVRWWAIQGRRFPACPWRRSWHCPGSPGDGDVLVAHRGMSGGAPLVGRRSRWAIAATPGSPSSPHHCETKLGTRPVLSDSVCRHAGDPSHQFTPVKWITCTSFYTRKPAPDACDGVWANLALS